MNRLTTEKPENNVENTLNLFYIKDKETWIRGGGLPPEYKDETLDNFMRRQIRERMAKWEMEIQVPEDWRAFSCMMAEWLFDDPESETGLLALLYAAAWGFAEIRERLKRYEDTGAMPDVLEDLLEGLTRIEKMGGWDLVDRWVKAAAEGRLVELPCKVGDTVFRLVTPKGGPASIMEIQVKTLHQAAGFVGNFGEKRFLISHYATREEAEAALKGEGHGK